MIRPRLLDLFCGGGGAAYGYYLAGYEVTGVDLVAQPRFPFTFIQADALEVLTDTAFLAGFDVIHASPPCQYYSQMSRCRPGLAAEYPDLIGPARELLTASGKPYIIENVEGARRWMKDPVMLCGGMSGLKVWRHRLFEASFPVLQPDHPAHRGSRPKTGRPPKPGDIVTVAGHTGDVDYARAAMGAWWMTASELSESIPPAYTVLIGLAAATALSYELPPVSVTLDELHQVRSNARAAERMRRYRARRRGAKGAAVAQRKPGPEPMMASHYAAELSRARTELALLRAQLGLKADDQETT